MQPGRGTGLGRHGAGRLHGLQGIDLAPGTGHLALAALKPSSHHMK